ncbi:hypothetical protein MKZ38_009404 [Zalerion maritima]|uniref:Uncharacterized protein n=1 Tax=Zalerion maritima TaxID=339359 RepID=A0AAD5RTG3_9PEZI|nr:hypothetical protein MKZ38_009404 [Zalerion maritima]
MASEASYSSELGILGPHDSMDPFGVPQPLHIVKRRESKYQEGGSRKSSTNTDDSLASVPEAPGTSKSINVYKKRRFGCLRPTDIDEEDEEEGRLLSVRFPNSQWDKKTSSSTSLLAGISPLNDASTSTSSLSISCASPVKSISSMSRGKYHPKKALGGLNRDHSKRHKSESKSSSAEPLQLHAASPVKSCHDLRGSVSFPSRASFDLERHLHESIIEEGFHGREACVLSPQVVVTPEVKALDAGNVDLWVAVQVFGKLCRTRDSPEREAAYEDASCHRSTYGHLYDLKIDILPTKHSSVLEIIGNSGTSRTLHLNSRILVLAHISLSSSLPPDLSLPLRHRSEELMADLEFHLGSIRTEYLLVRLTYSHSAFPNINNTAITDGVAIVNNKIITIATAVVKRHNSSSLWSPPPAPVPNPLFEIISSHWGSVRTADLIGRIAGHSRSTPRKPRMEPTPMNEKSIDSSTLSSLEKTPSKNLLIPARRASLKRAGPAPLSPQTPSEVEGSSGLTLEDEDEEDPARKIWTAMRKASRGTTGRVGAVGSFRVSKNGGGGARPISPSLVRVAAGGRISPKSARRSADKRREALLERAVRNKRSLGGETLRRLVPSLEGMKIEKDKENDGENTGDAEKMLESGRPPDPGGGPVGKIAPVKRQFSNSSTRKRALLGWGWGSWWS